MAVLKADVERLRAWIGSPFPKALKAYDKNHDYIVVEIFNSYRDSKTMVDSRNRPIRENCYFGLGRILQIGNKIADELKYTTAYKVGSLVRLRDSEVKSLLNPAWVAWNYGEYSKSPTTKPLGEQPPKYISNAFDLWRRNYVVLNPLEREENVDYQPDIFFVGTSHLVCVIEDWEVWAKDAVDKIEDPGKKNLITPGLIIA